MTPTLYVEGSLCLRTGAAGWGAVMAYGPLVSQTRCGAVPGRFEGAVTLMELAAAETAFVALGLRVPELTLALRSTAALAVLRWVFPAAPYSGPVEIQPPKRLKANVRDFPPLYELHDLVEARKVHLSLQLSESCIYTETASALARQCMEHERQPRRFAR